MNEQYNMGVFSGIISGLVILLVQLFSENMGIHNLYVKAFILIILSFLAIFIMLSVPKYLTKQENPKKFKWLNLFLILILILEIIEFKLKLLSKLFGH